MKELNYFEHSLCFVVNKTAIYHATKSISDFSSTEAEKVNI